MKAMIGTKLGMTQIIGSDGVVTPVTLIQAGPVTVTQLRTMDTDGYTAVQLAYGKGKKMGKSLQGHVKEAKVEPKVIREFRVDELPADIKIGDTFSVSEFNIGDVANATGTSKGKGFAGTIKRHNFSMQRRTHGGKGNTRKPGSVGSMYPQKIWKGKKMAGRMGGETVTVKNLVVSYIDADANVIGLRGAVPGPRKSIVTIGGRGAK